MGYQKYSVLLQKAKYDTNALMEIITRMQPLIKKYAKHLFFMEYEDATQELTLSIIEAVYSISKYPTDAECITYIENAVKYKFSHLCKKNIYREQHEDIYTPADNSSAFYQDFSLEEFKADWADKIHSMPSKHQIILQYILLGYSDKEIAKRIGLSRQYVNRIKKTWFRNR